MRFHFRLQNILNLRKHEEELSKVEYLKEKAELEKQREILKKMEGEYREFLDQVERDFNRIVESGLAMSYKMEEKLWEERLRKQRDIIREQERVVEEKLKLYDKNKMEVKKLEKLREKEFNRVRKESIRKENYFLDEVGLNVRKDKID